MRPVYIPGTSMRDLTDRLNMGKEECRKTGYHRYEVPVEPLYSSLGLIPVWECFNCGDAYTDSTRTLPKREQTPDKVDYLLVKV